MMELIEQLILDLLKNHIDLEKEPEKAGIKMLEDTKKALEVRNDKRIKSFQDSWVAPLGETLTPEEVSRLAETLASFSATNCSFISKD